MKTIKFRGKSKYSGKFVYGGLYDGGNQYYIVNVYYEGKASSNFEEMFTELEPIYPETIAQLVGYDANGNEVYEGDKFTDKIGHTFTARLQPQGFCEDGHICFDWMPDRYDFQVFTFPDDFDVEEDFVNADKNNL